MQKKKGSSSEKQSHTSKISKELDGVLKRLFGIKLMVRSLLKEFRSILCLPSLENGTLEAFPTEHVSENYKLKRNDLIWKFKNSDGDDCYFLLMLEFQSTVDRFMAQRIMTYVALVYDRLKNTDSVKKMNNLLPQIYPVVLYIGEQPWTAPLSTTDLIKVWSKETKHLVPNVTYVVLDSRRLPDELMQKCNEAAGLFLECERARTPQDALKSFKRFYTYLSQDISRNSSERNEFDELKKFLLEWYRLFLTVKGVKSEDIKKITQLEEVSSMFDNCDMRWDMLWSPEINAKMEKFLAQKAKAREEGLAEGRAEGRVKGIEEGRKEGRKEGQAKGEVEGKGKMLRQILSLRFGSLPDEIKAKIAECKESAIFDLLTPWALKAKTLGEFQTKLTALLYKS